MPQAYSIPSPAYSAWYFVEITALISTAAPFPNSRLEGCPLSSISWAIRCPALSFSRCDRSAEATRIRFCCMLLLSACRSWHSLAVIARARRASGVAGVAVDSSVASASGVRGGGGSVWRASRTGLVGKARDVEICATREGKLDSCSRMEVPHGP